MKRWILAFVIMMIAAFPMTSYAGQWQEDTTGWRYQDDDGTYKKGWYQDIDSKWYYFDAQTSYMLSNTTMPDGYTVAEDGKWVEGGGNALVLNEKTYDNKVELNITAYDDSPAGINQLGYSVPVIIFYDTNYIYADNRKASVNKLEVSKDGALYVNYTMKAEGYLDCLDVITEYTYEDGSQTNYKEQLLGFVEDESGSCPLLINIGRIKKKPVSIVVHIDAGSIK